MFKNLIAHNKVLILMLAISIIIIISYGITYNIPVIVDVNSEIVNFYYGKLIDLCIGYIVSFIFFIIVVYSPEYKKRKNIRCKTHVIFARIQTSLRTYINACLYGFQIEVLEKEDVLEKWKEHFADKNIDICLELSRDLDDNLMAWEFSRFGRSYIEVLNACANNFLAYKRELIPFLMFLDEKEIDLYVELEELLIFENIVKGLKEICVESLFYDEFEPIVHCFFHTNDVVGVKRQIITCELK